MDWTTLAVAGMSLVGTLSGTFGGILVSSKLTTYRIEQLEKRVLRAYGRRMSTQITGRRFGINIGGTYL